MLTLNRHHVSHHRHSPATPDGMSLNIQAATPCIVLSIKALCRFGHSQDCLYYFISNLRFTHLQTPVGVKIRTAVANFVS
jgi:hypothetical protein